MYGLKYGWISVNFTRDVFMNLPNVYDADFCGNISQFLAVKDTLKAFDDFKEKEKSAWSNIFRNVKVCTFRKIS